jgi:hypothetical protein
MTAAFANIARSCLQSVPPWKISKLYLCTTHRSSVWWTKAMTVFVCLFFWWVGKEGIIRTLLKSSYTAQNTHTPARCCRHHTLHALQTYAGRGKDRMEPDIGAGATLVLRAVRNTTRVPRRVLTKQHDCAYLSSSAPRTSSRRTLRYC